MEDGNDEEGACKSTSPFATLRVPATFLPLLTLPDVDDDDDVDDANEEEVGSAVVANAGEEEGAVVPERSPDTSACQSKSMTKEEPLS